MVWYRTIPYHTYHHHHAKPKAHGNICMNVSMLWASLQSSMTVGQFKRDDEKRLAHITILTFSSSNRAVVKQPTEGVERVVFITFHCNSEFQKLGYKRFIHDVQAALCTCDDVSASRSPHFRSRRSNSALHSIIPITL